MRHLSAEQFVDVAEGHGQAADTAHVEGCAACRSDVDQLRRALALAGTDPVPEPSPLFWDHLSTRVGQAVREEADAGVRGAPSVWRWLSVPAVALIALVTALVFMPRPAPEADRPAPARAEMPAVADAARPATQNESWFDDAGWALMGELSRDVMEADPAAALPATPGTVDRALGQLNDRERAALVAIIQHELSQASEAGSWPLGA